MTSHKIGWIGLGRMGDPMAGKLVKKGYDVAIWNRTKAKAEPLAKLGAKLADKPSDLAGVDILFTMVSTGKDVEQIYFGKDGVATGAKCSASPLNNDSVEPVSATAVSISGKQDLGTRLTRRGRLNRGLVVTRRQSVWWLLIVSCGNCKRARSPA